MTRIVIERSEEYDPATGEPFWRVVDRDWQRVPQLLVDGCESLSDALDAAAVHGYLTAGCDGFWVGEGGCPQGHRRDQ